MEFSSDTVMPDVSVDDVPPLDWTLIGSPFSSDSEEDSTSESVVESGDEKKKKGYSLRSRYVLVTWSRSRISDANEFYQKLVAAMPSNTQIYGCQELHKDGTPHYHAVIQLPQRVHWRNAQQRFSLELDDGTVDTTAINFETRRPGQSLPNFLKGTQNYTEKMENPVLFGERIQDPAAQEVSDRKRVYGEFVYEPDSVKAEEMIKQVDPFVFVVNYSNIRRFLDDKDREFKRRRIGTKTSSFEPASWSVPEVMKEWKRVNIDEPRSGRASALVLVGDSKLGKTEWAKSVAPNPIVMTETWNMSLWRDGATHIVVNDVNPLKFGCGGEAYWRAVLGCQLQFSAGIDIRGRRS